ncbi:hypothetical protein Tco_1337999 [Tanacetum coccineum]
MQMLPKRVSMRLLLASDGLAHSFLALLVEARPSPSVGVAKQSEVNDEPIKSKLASFIMGQRRPFRLVGDFVSSACKG